MTSAIQAATLDWTMEQEPFPPPAEETTAVEPVLPSPVPARPVPAEERLALIDALRGAALFGILMANMRGFAFPFEVYINSLPHWTDLPNRLAQIFVETFVMNKFITIFAVMFGLGFGIQMDRAAARSQGPGVYRRRICWLLAFGAVHGLLIWWGDILFTYALGGFFLMLFRNTTQHRLIRWAWALYLFILVPFVGMAVASAAGFGIPTPPQQTPEQLAAIIKTYAHGSFVEVTRQRVREFGHLFMFLPLFLPRIVGLFAAGLYLWRQGYLRDPEAHLDWWRRAQRWGFAIGLPCNVAAVAIHLLFKFNPMAPSPATAAVLALLSFGPPALSLCYASTLVLAWRDPAWRARLQPFACVGRMALTNYLMQSVVCTTIFYSHGLRLYGQGGPLIYLLMTVVIYGLQAPFSQWWLSRHRWGPMEKLWRTLTYGRDQLA